MCFQGTIRIFPLHKQFFPSILFGENCIENPMMRWIIYLKSKEKQSIREVDSLSQSVSAMIKIYLSQF